VKVKVDHLEHLLKTDSFQSRPPTLYRAKRVMSHVISVSESEESRKVEHAYKCVDAASSKLSKSVET